MLGLGTTSSWCLPRMCQITSKLRMPLRSRSMPVQAPMPMPRRRTKVQIFPYSGNWRVCWPRGPLAGVLAGKAAGSGVVRWKQCCRGCDQDCGHGFVLFI